MTNLNLTSSMRKFVKGAISTAALYGASALINKAYSNHEDLIDRKKKGYEKVDISAVAIGKGLKEGQYVEVDGRIVVFLYEENRRDRVAGTSIYFTDRIWHVVGAIDEDFYRAARPTAAGKPQTYSIVFYDGEFVRELTPDSARLIHTDKCISLPDDRLDTLVKCTRKLIDDVDNVKRQVAEENKVPSPTKTEKKAKKSTTANSATEALENVVDSLNKIDDDDNRSPWL